MAAPRGPTRRLCGVHIFIFILYTIYSRGIQPSVNRRVFKPLNPSRVINPTGFTNLFRVGLKSHIVFKHAGDVAKGYASDWMGRGLSRVDRVYKRTTDRDQRHVRFKIDYNGPD